MSEGRIRNLGTFVYRKILDIFAGSGLRKIWIVEKTNLLIRSLLKPEFVITKKYGHKMFLDKIDSLYLSVRKDWEMFETRLIEKNLKKEQVALDIGANIGFYTLIMARLVGEKGKVYAFEADPENFNILKKNVAVNGYRNVILVNKAVLDKGGKVRFYVDKGNTAGNSLFRGNKNDYNEIEGIRIDDFLPKKERVSLIKMDIEGSEGRAAMGMIKTLRKNKNIKLITEFYPKLLDEVGKRVNLPAMDYLKLLKKEGFKFWDIDDKNDLLVPSSPEAAIKKAGKQWTNLFCER